MQMLRLNLDFSRLSHVGSMAHFPHIVTSFTSGIWWTGELPRRRLAICSLTGSVGRVERFRSLLRWRLASILLEETSLDAQTHSLIELLDGLIKLIISFPT